MFARKSRYAVSGYAVSILYLDVLYLDMLYGVVTTSLDKL